MAVATTRARPWELVLPDPLLDAVLEQWTAEAALAETQREIDRLVMHGFDLDRPVDLERVIGLVAGYRRR
jgi:hypothetical protein